jgi:MoaA/NifB/PqqE/SkfB family radical SAM enzyme
VSSVGNRFVLTGLKRVFDSRAMYAQVVVTDDCNLSCSYCNEYTPNAPKVPLAELKRRIDKLDSLGVQVYDFLGGEPLMHPDIAELVRYVKSKRGGSNLVTIITNAFLLSEGRIHELNDAGLDNMQVSVDSIAPLPGTYKTLKSVMPRLRLLAREAKFRVKIQTVLNDATCDSYDAFRAELSGLPFAFGVSILHGPGGRIAIRGQKFIDLLSRHGIVEGVNFYWDHLKEMLEGDFSRPWKCLAGFKFLYVNAAGNVQLCSQQRDLALPLASMTTRELKDNDRHKPCESGCALGCVRMASHALGEPLKSLGSSARLALKLH